MIPMAKQKSKHAEKLQKYADLAVKIGVGLQAGHIGEVLSFLAAVYPAWQASRMDPVEALRHE